MPASKYESKYGYRADLALSMESTDSTGGDDDGNDENDVLLKRDRVYKNNDKSKERKVHLLPRLRSSIDGGQRHQVHRGARRLTRLLFCALLVPMLLFLFYLNLYHNASLRRGKNSYLLQKIKDIQQNAYYF